MSVEDMAGEPDMDGIIAATSENRQAADRQIEWLETQYCFPSFHNSIIQ